MQGESHTQGRVYHVGRWRGYSDKRKLRYLREMVVKYGNDPEMRWFTVNQVLKPAGVQPRDYAGQCRALLKYVQEKIYYTNEPGEQLQSPWWTLRVKTGDCDDMAILLASMAHSIRLPWRFVLGGKLKRTGAKVRWPESKKGPPRDAEFYHIYLDLGWPPFSEASGRTQWAAAEPTMRGAPLGYDVVRHGLKRFDGRGPSAMPELAGYGAWGISTAQKATTLTTAATTQTSILPPDSEEAYVAQLIQDKGIIKGVVAAVPWWSIFIAGLQGLVVTVLTTKYLESQEKKR